MVAWAQATVPASLEKTSSSEQFSESQSYPSQQIGSLQTAVRKALSCVSDPYVDIQSQTKNL